jgi:hypothetical protein
VQGFPEFDFIGQQVNLMAVLYFYTDESGKYRKNPVITVSGVGATSERLGKFNTEWVALLRSCGLGELKMSRAGDLTQAVGPKMPSGQSIEERTQALLPFADCINEYMEVGLMQGWDVRGYNNLPLEVKNNLGGSHDPFYLCFIRAMLQLGDMLREEDTLSVICDDDELTAWDAYVHYRAISKAEPKLNRMFSSITFAKSHHFSPLQAADMVAFLARKEASERFWAQPNPFGILFGYLVSGPKKKDAGIMNWYDSFISEQGFVDLANNLLKEKLPKPRIGD